MDRISHLPECIIHRILSSLNTPQEVVRMSVLSKNWFDLTASFPILDFSIRKFTQDSHASRESFFKYVEYTTSRFCHQNVITDTFNLITTIREPAELDVVNKCLELVLKNGVRELVVDIITFSCVQTYRLPNILLSVSMLKSLTICNCELPSSLMVDAIKFNSLIRLELVNVQIDEEVIKYLTTSCPLLQVLMIRWCHGFKRFCVYSHQNLQSISIEYKTPVERIDIEAPNLSNLLVLSMDGRGAPQMDLASCKRLKTVTYYGHPLPYSNDFTDFLSNFPFIENLVLSTKDICNKLTLSCHSLRTLVLYSHIDLEDIELSTPNLVSFSIYRLSRPIVMDECWPLLRDSTHLKACMQCYSEGYIDTLWFQKLRRFLDKKDGFKVLNLYIHAIYSQKFIELKKLKAIESPPYELEHVELQLDTHKESSAHLAFVDALLWCCRPRSLTLRSSFPLTAFEDLVKFTREKLLEQEDQGRTNIQIVCPSSSNAQKHLSDLKSLSMALPRGRKTFTFIKEEGMKVISKD